MSQPTKHIFQKQLGCHHFSGFWLRSKCSICSYQFNIWYEGHGSSSILIWYLIMQGDGVLELAPALSWVGPALQCRRDWFTSPIKPYLSIMYISIKTTVRLSKSSTLHNSLNLVLFANCPRCSKPQLRAKNLFRPELKTTQECSLIINCWNQEFLFDWFCWRWT
jgi:hypothetical protein